MYELVRLGRDERFAWDETRIILIQITSIHPLTRPSVPASPFTMRTFIAAIATSATRATMSRAPLIQGAHPAPWWNSRSHALTSLPPDSAASQSAELVNSGSPLHIGSFPKGAVPGQFTTERFIDADGAQMTYYLYVPKGYDPTRQYPLALVLHGAGERASSNKTADQNRANLLGQNYVQAFVAPSVQEQWPSFVVVPQIASPSARWVNVPGATGSYTLSSQPSVSLQTAVDIVATVERAYVGVDRNRQYITGISMGAYGVWDAIERWPTLFAAAAPISGAGDPHEANQLVQLPIWDFHGSRDTLVPVSGSRQMYAAIQAAGGRSCYTELPGYGHDLWNTVKVYSYTDVERWLFAQTTAPVEGEQPPSCAGLIVHGVPAK
jgi:dienelactone hydrolase